MHGSGDWKVRLAKAIDSRRGLLSGSETDVCRVLHGEADGFPGVFVDRYGPGLALLRHEGRVEQGFDAHAFAAEALARLEPFGIVAVYDKPFVRDRSRLGGEHDAGLNSLVPIAGVTLPEHFAVNEHGRLFEVRLYDGFSTGLFLDQRLNRSFLAEGSEGARVLNTFAYTGGFSVACARRGAMTTTVDVSQRYLDWAKRNMALNSIDASRHHFARMDTFEFLAIARRKPLFFDLVILDPPTFSSGDKKRGVRPWSAARDYPRLISEACNVLAPGGLVFASTNATELCEPGRLKQLVAEAAGRVSWRPLPEMPADFPGGRECASCVLFGR